MKYPPFDAIPILVEAGGLDSDQSDEGTMLHPSNKTSSKTEIGFAGSCNDRL